MLNKQYFQTWLTHTINSTNKKDRYLFFDIDNNVTDQIYSVYQLNKSLDFLNDLHYLWCFSDVLEHINFAVKDKVSHINYSDLVKARNLTDQNINFVVLIPSNCENLPSNSSDSTSEVINNSDANYLEYMNTEIFEKKFGYQYSKRLEQLKNLFLNDFKNKCGDFFFKEVNKDSILEFYGIIGSEVHFEENVIATKSLYFKGFIEKVQEYLQKFGFSGLESRLTQKSVKNANTVIDLFRNEDYEQAKDFLQEINLVFLKDTLKYKKLIDVDEWIEALKDEVDKSNIGITYDDVDSCVFSMVNINNVSDTSNSRKYLLKRDTLFCYLDNKALTDWSINNVPNASSSVNCNILNMNSLEKVSTSYLQKNKVIQLVNYSLGSIPDDNSLDFGIKVSTNIGNNHIDIGAKIKNFSKKKIEEIKFEEINQSIENFIKETDEPNLELKEVDSKLTDLTSENALMYNLEHKELLSGSDVEISLRTIESNTSIAFVGFQDKEGDFICNYKSRTDISISPLFDSSTGFTDSTFSINNVTEGMLFIKIENSINLKSKWIIIEFIPKGTKTDVFVKNFFQKLKAKNDSDYNGSSVIIEKRNKNKVHSYYFENVGPKTNFLPTIFNLSPESEIIKTKDICPVISDKKITLQVDFRPSLNDFESVLNESAFLDYQTTRDKVALFYKRKLKGNKIQSIEDIDFGDEELIDISKIYLDQYHNLLKINPVFSWVDLFFIVEKNDQHQRLEEFPLATFFSPYHPLFLHQASQKFKLLKETLEVREGKIHPNSMASLVDLNEIENWIIDTETENFHFVKIDTDSLLFTGFINAKKAFSQNNLSEALHKIGVEYNQSMGHLSPSQIRSALNKSFAYLSNKPVFNILLEGKLYDSTSNTAILNWIKEASEQTVDYYHNYELHVNVFDNRESVCFPNSNLISYYKNELGLRFNWFKGDKGQEEFDITLLTSMIPDIRSFHQTDKNSMSKSFTYKNISSYQFNNYDAKFIYRDIFINRPSNTDNFGEVLNFLESTFKTKLKENQFRSNLANPGFERSEVLAISSDILNANLLQEATNKTLWEFNISDYSFKDNGRGDYYLLAKEQEVYFKKFKNFLISIDPKAGNIASDFIEYSKQTGLFELKYLISNQNFLKGFIASIAARKIVDCAIGQHQNMIFVPYDVFKDRLHKIKKEVNPDFQKTGTQFPDFVMIEFNDSDKNKPIIDFRLVEIKYRSHEIQGTEIVQILNDQTLKIKKIFSELNKHRISIQSNGLWKHTLNLILSEMVQYYNENTKFSTSELASNFASVINEDYDFRINDSLIVCVDDSNSFNSGKTSAGIFYKIPKGRLNEVFDCDNDLNNNFKSFYYSMERTDTVKDLEIVPSLALIEDLTPKQIEEADKLVDKAIDEIRQNPEFYSDLSPMLPEELEGVLSAADNTASGASSDQPLPVESTAKQKDVEFEIERSIEKDVSPNDSLNISQEVGKAKKSHAFDEVVFGKDNSNRQAVFYPSGRPGSSPLPNYNIMVTGSSGKGKTQFIKSFIYQQSQSGTSFTIIDFKNDYSDKYFCNMCDAQKIEVKFEGIPYNPLIPRLGVQANGKKYYDVSEHINAICAVFGNTFGLGIQQESELKKAVRKVFKNQGINPKGILDYNESIVFPSFNDVGEYLEEGDKELEKLYNRLDPLFDLNLFRDKFKNIGFSDIIKNSNIIKVSDIQNDKIKNAIAKMIIVSAHGYHLGIPHSYRLNKMFVFDEAHRVLDSNFVEKFIRECRAFGVGLLLSSQQPGDFPDNVLNQLATKIIHGNDGDARSTKKIKDLISFNRSDIEINNLETFDAIVSSQDYDNWNIDTLAWPQLILLLIIRKEKGGITLEDIISNSKELGINKDWEDYLQMLAKKDYIVCSNSIYTIVD